MRNKKLQFPNGSKITFGKNKVKDKFESTNMNTVYKKILEVIAEVQQKELKNEIKN